jgi:hypothetical protein
LSRALKNFQVIVSFKEAARFSLFLKNNEKMRIGDFDSNNYMVIGNSFDCPVE